MTDNLRYKIDQVLEYMQNEFLALAGKLDTIITLLGGTPETPATTLSDLLTAIQATNVILTDMHLDTVSIDQKLLALRNAVVEPLDLGYLNVQAGTRMINVQLGQVIDLLTLGTPEDQLTALNSLQSTLTSIYSSLGTPTGDATTTVLGFLSSIQYCVCNLGLPPDEEESEACSESTGTTVYGWPLPDNPSIGIIYRTVTWDAAPEGTSFISEYDVLASNAVLEPTEDWAGWTIYVQSSASYFQLYPGAFSSEVTNTWLTLPSLSFALAPSVLNSQTIKVTLCPPAGAPEAEPCLTVDSEIVAVSPSFGYPNRSMAIFPTRSPGATITWPGGSITTDPPAIHFGDLDGHVISFVSGRVRVVFGVDAVSIDTVVLDASEESVTLPPGTEYVLFDDHPGPADTPGTGAFSVQWCLPEEV